MATFWKIEEAVGGGFYMDLDGIFETREACCAAIAKHRSNQDMRPVLYETGRWSGGAVRCDLYKPDVDVVITNRGS